MINQKLIDGLSEQLGQLLEGARNSSIDIELEQQIKALLQGTFNRMDLITRDEFDAQSAVLARTRTKLEQLEQQLQQLEQSAQQH